MTVLVVCLSFIFAACTPNEEDQTIKDEIKLNKTAITLEVGDSETLTATTNVQTGVKWTTNDAAVATVDGGVVTAVAAGTATITATAGTASATCTVTVTEAPEYVDLTVDETLLELVEGGASISVTATFTVNDEAQDCTFVWTSANDAIATVENGSITPVGVGSTVKEVKDASISYAQAYNALRYADTFAARGRVHSYREFVLVKMVEELSAIKQEEYRGELMDASAQEVFEDEELLATAEEFLLSDLNVSETSRNLYMHRNTLSYRLDKIEKATGLNIRHFSDAVSFRLLSVLYKILYK